MRDNYKVYTAKLHTLTPVFVGSGNEISKKEYRLLGAEKKILVYDPAKFYMTIKKLGKAKVYEDYLLSERSSDLNRWMQDNNLNPNIFSSAIRYSVNWGDMLELGKAKTQIMEFAKDPYGNPYVPGTGIKGMLRTILLGYEISKNKSRYADLANDIKNYECKKIGKSNYRKEAKHTEEKAFRTLRRDDTRPSDAVNDVLQGLIVSDSKPLKIKDLVLCQKIEYHTDQQKKPLNILRECLQPGVDIEFTITIDSSLCKYDAEIIMNAISMFNNMYYEAFLSKFGSKKRAPDTVYLGGGVGFVSKTFLYYMFRGTEGVKVASDVFKNTLPAKTYIEHKHKDDIRDGVSPHILKCTKYNGKCFQMGMCSFNMIPIKGG